MDKGSLDANQREELELLASELQNIEGERSPEDIANLLCELRYDFGWLFERAWEGQDAYVVSFFQEQLERLEKTHMAKIDRETLMFNFRNEYEKDPVKALHLFDLLFRHPQNVITRIERLKWWERRNKPMVDDISKDPDCWPIFVALGLMHHGIKGDEEFLKELPFKEAAIEILTQALFNANALTRLFEIRRGIDTVAIEEELKNDENSDDEYGEGTTA